MSQEPLDQVREICRTLPEAAESVSVHHPSFKVRKKTFAMYADADGPALWVKATADDQRELVASAPDRFFVPPYLGPKGWVGVRLDDAPDWREVAELLTDGYRLAAPKTLVRELDQGRRDTP